MYSQAELGESIINTAHMPLNAHKTNKLDEKIKAIVTIRFLQTSFI